MGWIVNGDTVTAINLLCIACQRYITWNLCEAWALWHLLTSKSNPAFYGMLIQFSVPVIWCPSKCPCLRCNRNDSISIISERSGWLYAPFVASWMMLMSVRIVCGAEEKWVFVYHFVCDWVHVKHSIPNNFSALRHGRHPCNTHGSEHIRTIYHTRNTTHGTRNKANDNNNNKFNELWWWAPSDVRHESDPIVTSGRWIRTSTSSPNVLLGLLFAQKENFSTTIILPSITRRRRCRYCRRAVHRQTFTCHSQDSKTFLAGHSMFCSIWSR